MSFKSLIQDLRGVRTSSTINSKLSTKALLIDQISHPINRNLKQLDPNHHLLKDLNCKIQD